MDTLPEGLFPPLVTILRRHKYLILGTMISATVASGLIVSKIKPLYVATATIKLQPTANPSALSGANPIAYAVQFDPAVVGTAIQVLRSPSIARKVLASLDLDKLPEFTTTSPLRHLINKAEHLIGLESVSPPNITSSTELIALRNLMNSVRYS